MDSFCGIVDAPLLKKGLHWMFPGDFWESFQNGHYIDGLFSKYTEMTLACEKIYNALQLIETLPKVIYAVCKFFQSQW